MKCCTRIQHEVDSYDSYDWQKLKDLDIFFIPFEAHVA